MINEVSNSSRGFVKRLIGFSSASWISAAISFISNSKHIRVRSGIHEIL